MLSQQAIQTILGIKEKTYIHSEDMAKQMIVSFYPQTGPISENIQNAQKILREKLLFFGVTEIPYSEVFVKMPFFKRLKRGIKLHLNNSLYLFKRMFGKVDDIFYIDRKTLKNLTSKFKYKSGVCIIVPGVLDTHDLPMQYIKSFKHNSIISILDFPESVSEETSFEHHFDVSMGMFAHNMANIVVAVNDEKWMIYNFNASHPIFDFKNEEKLNYFILHGLIPKVVAPISPHRMSEFQISKVKYESKDSQHAKALSDLQKGSALYAGTNLFPHGKKIDSLNFRNDFHRQIGKIHLDSRNGMSFGFTAKQMNTVLSQVKEITIEDKALKYTEDSDVRVSSNGTIYVVCEVKNTLLEIEVPEVWVLTLRSGSDKTNFNPEKDIIKMGLKNGSMQVQLPNTIVSLPRNYKPSFDTKVILAHAVGNAMNAAVAKFFNFAPNFIEHVEQEGYSISHWHGYFKKEGLPEDVYEYGRDNPHVACSSPQSAIYALDGKLRCFREILEGNKKYIGDIHVEPHHGSNICYPRLADLATYILEHKDVALLGNKYL